MSQEETIQNAVITSTMLGFEDHGFMTIMIMLDYGGAGQGYGGYVLDDKPVECGGNRQQTKLTGIAIAGILRSVGKDRWEDLKGAVVRVKKQGGYFGKVSHIGHYLKDDWFSFEEAFKEQQ